MQDDILQGIRNLARVWGVPRLEQCARVEFSPRLSKSLGMAYPWLGLVRLNPVLAGPAHRHLLAEVLCHEVAHVAVYELHGPRRRPHGPEWAALVRAAGFEPRSRMHLEGGPPTVRPRLPRPGPVFVHRCPVCGMERSARRPCPRWRCAACVAAGLEGRLLVTTRPGEAGG